MSKIDKSQTYSPTGNIKIEDRAKEVQDWNIDQAKQRARKEGIRFSVDHLAVVIYLREFYIEHGWPMRTHDLIRDLDQVFGALGGKQYLHKLFPDGPLAQASRLAGVPTPRNATHASFGSTY